MILRYRSGEEIKRGDRVLFHGEPGTIELVATDPQDPEQAWYLKEFGGGVQVSEPKHFGRAFVRAESIDEYEDLEFVSRAESK
jgi:hypothetical protein